MKRYGKYFHYHARMNLTINWTLVEYQGHLACIRNGEDLMELFLMEDYKNKVWSKRLNIKIKGLDPYI